MTRSDARHRGRRSRAAHLRFAAVLAGTALLTGYAPVVTTGSAVEQQQAAAAPTTARWSDGGATATHLAPVVAQLEVPPGPTQVLRVDLDGARFLDIPDGCMPSSTLNVRSRLSASVETLHCWVRGASRTRRITLTGLVVASAGQVVDGAVTSRAGTSSLGRRLVLPGRDLPASRLRLVSSPDFLNADVGDLRDSPARWTPRRHANSINGDYRRALDTVLDDWESLRPDAVLVAGDMVDGWWGTDPAASGTFGPVGTAAQRRVALERAAATYYPQWLQRFRERDLDVLTAMGDHEYGDDPWPARKGGLARSFEGAYARHLGKLPERTARTRFDGVRVSRPRGVHRTSAYAMRPRPDVQLITLNVFDITPQRSRVRLDEAQMRWLKQVLRRAERDQVRWIVVQGHTPILWPVRTKGSSGLHYEGGRRSELWRTFKRYGVDLYLTGEVHATTASEADGVTQIAHGGAFQYGLTTALVLDFTDDFAWVSLRDYDAVRGEARNGVRLWETRPAGMPARLRVDPDPFTIGTGILLPDGDLTRQSGILEPVD